jgi:polyhydroxybutyrate depolymerase
MRRSWFGVAAVALAMLAGCTSSAPGHPAGPTSPGVTRPAIPVGSSPQALSFGGVARTYRVYRPRSLPAQAPLVVVLHGALGNGTQAEASYGWDAAADAGRFVVAYPDGLRRTWAVSDGCCGPSVEQHVDDAGFVLAVVRAIGRAIPLDARRTYVTGISNGGMLAYRLACTSTAFAAIGPVSATMLNACPKPAPVSVVHVHGTADKRLPYGGGPGLGSNDGTGRRAADTDGPPIPALIATWRRTDACAAARVTRRGAVTTSVATCPHGRAVELVTIAGAGHQWPGQPGPSSRAVQLLHLDRPYPGLDATELIWRFFRSHPRP